MNDQERDVAKTKIYAIASVIMVIFIVASATASHMYSDYVSTTANAMYGASYRMQEAKANADKAMFETMPKGK